MKEDTKMQICLTEQECYFLIGRMKDVLLSHRDNHIAKSILKKLCNIYSTCKHKNIDFAKEYNAVWAKTEDTKNKDV